MTTTVIDIPLGDIHPSPFNHRKVFKDIEQLAESIKARGVLQPVTVRPNNKGWELVFGERRWRAAKVAGVETIPAIERKMTDVEVLEAQLIENVQRSDVHPMEEAEGYRNLIDNHKYSVEQIVAKTGKSRSAIYARLELCKLAPVARKAFLEDKLNASVALLIARIPDPKLQAQATAEVLGEGGWDDYEGGVQGQREIQDLDAKDKPVRERLPLSVREAQVHLQRKYMLRLAQAPFDTTDAKLVAKAGACTTCSFRTGNQPELFSDVKSPDVCTKPACFEEKKKADWDAKAAAAAREGIRVLNDRETKRVFSQYGDGAKVDHDSPYVDPSDPLPYMLGGDGRKTWKQLLGKAEPARAVAQDGAGAARILWDKNSAIATAKKAGKLKEAKAEAKARSSGNDEYQARQRKAEKESKRRHAIARIAFGKLYEQGTMLAGVELPVKFWRWLADSTLRMIDAEDCRNLCKRRELDCPVGSGKAEAALRKLVREAKTAGELIGLTAEFVSAFRAVGGVWAGYGENFTGAIELFKLDLKKLGAELDKAAKAKAAKKPAPAKKAKKGGAK